MSSNKCFICDSIILSDNHQLATYKLKKSKKQIFEKLGNLIGEKFVIVCHDTDGACDRCVMILESIDKLEHELLPLRKIILKFLEKKYSLEENELPCESDVEITDYDTNDGEPVTFMERKRRAEESIADLTKIANEDPRNNIWLECDTCHYTTNYPTFVDRHVKPDASIKSKQNFNYLNYPRIRKVETKTNEILIKTEDPLGSPSLLHDLLDNHCIENKAEFSSDANVSDLAITDQPPSENFDCYQVFEGSNPDKDTQEVFAISESGESVRVVWDEETTY